VASLAPSPGELTQVGFVGRSVGRGTAGDDLGPPNPAPPPSPLRTDDDASTEARCLYETEKAMKIAYFVQER